jgi:hypothetical protein
LAGDVLADGHAAGEGDQVHRRVREHQVGDLARVAGDDLQHLRRQAGFVQQVGKQQRRQRHLFAGLEHHAVVGGHRRHHLVRHLVHRVVEGRDGGDHAQQRFALRVHAPLTAVRRDVAAEGLRVVLQALVGAEHQHVGHAAGFVGAVLQAQAGFGGDQRGDGAAAFAHQGRGAFRMLLRSKRDSRPL